MDKIPQARAHFPRGLASHQPDVTNAFAKYFTHDIGLLLRMGISQAARRLQDAAEAESYRLQASEFVRRKESLRDQKKGRKSIGEIQIFSFESLIDWMKSSMGKGSKRVSGMQSVNQLIDSNKLIFYYASAAIIGLMMAEIDSS